MAPAEWSPGSFSVRDCTQVIVKPIVFAVLALIVLAALWFFFKPPRPELQAPVSAAGAGANAPLAMSVPGSTPGQQARTASPKNDVFELVIRDGKPASGPVVLQVHEGEHVTLHIRSDQSDELHLHGYDLHARLGPDQPASLQFTADRTGRFGLELHKSRAELGALEVYPQ
jgi:hypothetical protein